MKLKKNLILKLKIKVFRRERNAEGKLFDSFDDKKGHLPLIGQYLVLLVGGRKVLSFLLFFQLYLRIHTKFINIFPSLKFTGPSSSTVTIGRIINGISTNDEDGIASNAVTESTRCLIDRFQVTNPDGISPPIICGQNTGEHSE